MINLREIAEVFTGATAIRVICFDQALQIIPARSLQEEVDKLIYFDLAELKARLQDILHDRTYDLDQIETYPTENGFIYNIHFVREGNELTGFLVTEPLVLEKISDKKIDVYSTKNNLSIQSKAEFKIFSARLPVVSWRQIRYLGLVLQALCLTWKSHLSTSSLIMPDETIAVPALDITPIDSLYDHVLAGLDANLLLEASEKFMTMKDILQSGNEVSMAAFCDNNNMSDIHFDMYGKDDMIRSMKNYMIASVAMDSILAVEAGCDYLQMALLRNQMISQIEQMDKASDMIRLRRQSVMTFTRAVRNSAEHKLSRPTRIALLYIANQFRQQIRIRDIAEQAKVNETYLSSLVKQETGLSLLDHLNRVRVNEGKRLLTQTDLPIADIAQTLGFNYANHFASVFKKIIGISPTTYRSQKKAR